MADILTAYPGKETTPNKERKILSERVSFRNMHGLNIIGYFDHLIEWQERPFVVIPPAYGETKRDYISLSYYLTSNGFNVLRYDNTCHLGESDGDIIDADLLRMQEDLSTTVNFIEDKFLRHTVAVAATSLSGRIAIRLAVTDPRIAFLCILVGLVDLRGTFKSIYREDVIGEYRRGKYLDTLDIFGHEVRGVFIQNAVDNKLHDFNGTLVDVKQIKCPIVFLTAENDAWIKLCDARQLLEVARHPKSELRVIPGALHQLQENPRLAKLAIEQVVRSCKEHLGEKGESNSVVEPSLHDIVAQNKTELEQLKRLSRITRSGEKKFWELYLSKFSIALKLPDYKDLLESSEQLLDCLTDGSQILDAGCGNGHFGVWLLKRAVERLMDDKRATINLRYVGLDFAEKAVSEARKRHTEILRQLGKVNGYEKCKSSRLEYVIGDLDEELPFPDGYFDKICCNLVISYVRDPISVMKRFQRVLKKNGKIVVSSLKPYCDVSLIYKKFTEATCERNDLEEAIALLSNTGQIRRKESEGHYHFYNEEELQELICKAGLVTAKLLRSCGNQVNVALCEKS